MVKGTPLNGLEAAQCRQRIEVDRAREPALLYRRDVKKGSDSHYTGFICRYFLNVPPNDWLHIDQPDNMTDPGGTRHIVTANGNGAYRTKLFVFPQPQDLPMDLEQDLSDAFNGLGIHPSIEFKQRCGPGEEEAAYIEVSIRADEFAAKLEPKLGTFGGRRGGR